MSLKIRTVTRWDIPALEGTRCFEESITLDPEFDTELAEMAPFVPKPTPAMIVRVVEVMTDTTPVTYRALFNALVDELVVEGWSDLELSEDQALWIAENRSDEVPEGIPAEILISRGLDICTATLQWLPLQRAKQFSTWINGAEGNGLDDESKRIWLLVPEPAS